MAEALFPRNLRGIVKNGVDSYDLLPQPIRDMHDVANKTTATGQATITRDASVLAKLAAWVMRFPKEGHAIALTTTFNKLPAGEMLHRSFNGECFTTYFYDHPKAGHFIERFGPFWFLVENDCSEEGIDMFLRRFWLWKHIPLPLWLAPHIDATERVDAQGRYQFDVDIHLPLIGRVIHYQGWLVKESAV